MGDLPRTLDQQRASYANDIVQRHLPSQYKQSSRYATLGQRLPTMVLQNGLGQALAYLLADAEGRPSPAQDLYQELQEWLCGAPNDTHPARVYRAADLMQSLMSGSRADYQRAQLQALALLAWVRKFVNAYLTPEER